MRRVTLADSRRRYAAVVVRPGIRRGIPIMVQCRDHDRLAVGVCSVVRTCRRFNRRRVYCLARCLAGRGCRHWCYRRINRLRCAIIAGVVCYGSSITIRIIAGPCESLKFPYDWLEVHLNRYVVVGHAKCIVCQCLLCSSSAIGLPKLNLIKLVIFTRCCLDSERHTLRGCSGRYRTIASHDLGRTSIIRACFNSDIVVAFDVEISAKGLPTFITEVT